MASRSHLWLLVNYEQKKFDYFIKDRNNPSFCELVVDLDEEALKQDVLIPELWNMYYKNTSNDMIQVNNESGFLHTVQMYPNRDTVEVWIVGTEEPSLYFRVALEVKQRRREAQERMQREREEILRRRAQEEEKERLRKEKEEEEERLRKEQEEEEERLRKEQEELGKPVVVEVPIVDVHTGNASEYVRIYSAPGYEGTKFTHPAPLHLPNLPLGKVMILPVLYKMCLWYLPSPAGGK